MAGWRESGRAGGRESRRDEAADGKITTGDKGKRKVERPTNLQIGRHANGRMERQTNSIS